MKIYTKTGDQGETCLFAGKRVLKNHPFLEALGAVDETNCAIGAALSQFPAQALMENRQQLETIQHALFDLGAALATPRSQATPSKIQHTRFDDDSTKQLEMWIDAMEEQLPKLTTFILPGGHPAGALLHLARTLCRRAERAVVPISKSGDVDHSVVVYLNRLSDYLFVTSRYVNQQAGCTETLWQHHKK